ncbi:ATP-binding cassette domain-containing protein [Desulfobacterales bacterium HSG16]|nr:ATP-binding cassette domain-containing protein [Desulfobacterales bacterium HSG16]
MINLKNLTKYFHQGSVNQVLALNDLSLNVDDGDFITVIGSNGAGKSTLLNCIAGSFFPDKGKILLKEQDITTWAEYRRAAFVGRVFQDPLLGTCAELSIEQNMALAAKRGAKRGLGRGVRSKDRSRFSQALKPLGLGLEDRLKDSVGLLSGGQRQALTMLMATIVRPEILLLDEHTAALDPKTAHQILDLTRNMVKEHKFTTLMVTHNMHHALNLGNRLIMLHRGQIILDISDEEKKSYTVEDLVARFYEIQGEEFSSDRILLA